MIGLSDIQKPYLWFCGNNASDVTGSCTILRWHNYKIAIDMGLIQTNNIVADYKANKEMYKQIKPKEIHAVYITHIHSDHVGGLLIAEHMGMNAHIYVPKGCLNLLKIMLTDSVKIMTQDSMKLQSKHGIKVLPLATEEDIEKVLNRCIEIPFNEPTETFAGIICTLYHAGHIICSSQIVLELKEGYKIKRLGFTGDINTYTVSKSVEPLDPLPFVDILIGESTYSDKHKNYSIKKDRGYDLDLIKTAVNQYNKILIPVFSLQRAEDIMQTLYNIDIKLPIYFDTPLGIKLYNAWTEPLDFENKLNLKFINEWAESKELQNSNEHCIILSSGGMLHAGRAVSHLKSILPNKNNCILFCGFSAENTTATAIKRGDKSIIVDGETLPNNCQIYSLNTFSSHANYSQLMQYYQTIKYNKLALVHGTQNTKINFANELQNKLYDSGVSAKVVAVSKNQKIYL